MATESRGRAPNPEDEATVLRASELPADWKPGHTGVILDDETYLERLRELLRRFPPQPLS